MKEHVFDKYKNRMNRSGSNVGESLTNNTISFIESTFHASPTYRVMAVESSKYPELIEIDGRVVEVERLGTLREIILRPTQSLEIGMYVEIDGEWYLLIDKYGGTGSTSIKMLAIKINQSLKWYDENGELQNFKCVASATDLGSKSRQSKNEIEWNKYDVRLPIGQLFVSVELNDFTDKIGLNHRFIFGRNVYEITGVDDITNISNDGYGIVQFTAKITTKRNNDNFELGIAENLYGDIYNLEDNTQEEGISTLSIDTETKKDDNKGRLW